MLCYSSHDETVQSDTWLLSIVAVENAAAEDFRVHLPQWKPGQ